MNWQRHSKSYNVNEAFDLGESSLRKPSKHPKETIRERSDSQSSVEDDGPVPHPRGLPTKAHSIDFGLDDDVDDGRRSCCNKCLMVLFIAFFVFALMACVAIILYFVLINTVFMDSFTSSRNTLSGALTIEGSLLLNETFHPDLADPSSIVYREMENKFISSMNVSFSNSSLSNVYDGTRVVRFEQGSIRIIFEIIFRSSPNDADTEAEVILEVQVTIRDGINDGLFDEFDVIVNSLQINIAILETTSAAAAAAITTTTRAPVEPTTIPLSVGTTFKTVTETVRVTMSSTTVESQMDSGVTSTTIPRFPNETTTLDNATPSTTMLATATTITAITSTMPTAPDTTNETAPFTTKFVTVPTATSTATSNATTTSITRIMTSATPTTPTEAKTTQGAIQTTHLVPNQTVSTVTTPSTAAPTTVLSSTPSLSEVNITRQPKIHPALPDICGIRPAVNGSIVSSASRVVGGTPSALGNWPWLGSLRRGTSHQCGAVLIHPEWAITAHHCVGYFDNIVLGDIDLLGETATSPYRVQRSIQSFGNPDFNPTNDNGDIALVRLTEAVEFNDYVQPLCINTLMTEMTSFNNCFVAGWGTDDILNQVAMRYQQEADIVQIDRTDCSSWYESYHVITDQHICAGEENGRRDSCSGDSGGPLQCQDEQGIWYLLGVVSFGEGCGQPRLPGVYARVSKLIPFLSQILDTNIKR